MTDIVTYCDVNTCEDCPRYGDDCDGDKRVEHTDLISRADAIEMAVDVETPQGTYERAIYVDDLMALPSAVLPNGDLISRADAIAYIDRVIKSGLGRYKSLDYIRKYISALPSADAVSREKYDKLIQELNDSPKGKWIPLDGKLPKIIGEHVLVTIKWADDDLEVCEMCPTVADRYNIIAFQQMPLPYDGEPLKSELQCSGARMKGGDDE